MNRYKAVVVTLGMLALWTMQPALGDETTEGLWSDPVQLKPHGYDKGTLGVHSILLHTGKVLCIDMIYPVYTPDWADAVLFDPNDPNAIQVAWEGTNDPNGIHDPNYLYPNGHYMFCSGHAQINDGKILIVGGDPGCQDLEHLSPDKLPPFKTTLYVPDLNGGPGTWEAGPDEVWDIDPAECLTA